MHRSTTYPVWIDSQTTILLDSRRADQRAGLVFNHGREGDPPIALVGTIEQIQRLIIEADCLLTRHRYQRRRALE